MEVAKCRNRACGKVLKADDTIWQVRTGWIGESPVYAPTCSKECALLVQKELADEAMAKYNDVMGQSFQTLKLSDF